MLILLILSGFLMACSNQKPAESKAAASSVTADDDNDSVTTGELVLNNGARWRVDAITNYHVNDLQAISKRFDKGRDRSLAAYKKARLDLQAGINKMIADCKMTGADHEALHKWLAPLIGRVAELEKAVTTEDAGEVYGGIKSQLDRYNQYFESLSKR